MNTFTGGWAELAGADPAGDTLPIAYFVSPHGYGHATRAAAVVAALRERVPNAHFHIFTRAPEWVFAETLGGGFTYHSAVTDVGMVQASALVEDLDATIARLDELLPYDPHLLKTWADWLHQLRCALVLCDISPLGLAVAHAAELPSVLIENFTWDWIYAGYVERDARFGRYLEPLRAAFALATHHLQTDPLCAESPQANARLAPIARPPRQTRAATRAALGLEAGERMVLVTLGGTGSLPAAWPATTALPKVVFVFPGGAAEVRREGQRLLLPHQGAFFHPDLIAASDAILGKTGYSTVAETYHAGVPYGFVSREMFRESPYLADFIRRHVPSLEIPTGAFEAGQVTEYVAELLRMQPRTAVRPNGAEQAAAYVAGLLA